MQILIPVLIILALGVVIYVNNRNDTDATEEETTTNVNGQTGGTSGVTGTGQSGGTTSVTVGGTVTGTIQPTPTGGGSVGLSAFADDPLPASYQEPVGVRWLKEHRSALNGKIITTRGIVTASWMDQSHCPDNAELLCPQQRIFIADTNEITRNQLFDLQIDVLSNHPASDFKIGSTISIRVMVTGSRDNVEAREY